MFLALYLEWMPEEERAWWVGAWEKKYTVVVLSTREGGSNQILGTRFVKNPRQVKNHFSPLLFQVTHSSWSWIFEGLFEMTQCPCPPFLNPLYTLLSSDNIAIFQACLAERAKHAIIISFFTLLVSVSHTVKWHFSSVTGNLRTIYCHAFSWRRSSMHTNMTYRWIE